MELASNWILTSCQSHRITFGQSNSVISRFSLFENFPYNKSFLESVHNPRPYANIERNLHTLTKVKTFWEVSCKSAWSMHSVIKKHQCLLVWSNFLWFCWYKTKQCHWQQQWPRQLSMHSCEYFSIAWWRLDSFLFSPDGSQRPHWKITPAQAKQQIKCLDL